MKSQIVRYFLLLNINGKKTKEFKKSYRCPSMTIYKKTYVADEGNYTKKLTNKSD